MFKIGGSLRSITHSLSDIDSFALPSHVMLQISQQVKEWNSEIWFINLWKMALSRPHLKLLKLSLSLYTSDPVGYRSCNCACTYLRNLEQINLLFYFSITAVVVDPCTRSFIKQRMSYDTLLLETQANTHTPF